MADISEMVGKTMVSAEIRNYNDDDVLVFTDESGREYKFYHCQDCCEWVRIEDVCGDLADLINSPLIQAEEVSNEPEPNCESESYTWTFYKFATIKGSVTVRWLGTSNGYYSEGVDFCIN